MFKFQKDGIQFGIEKFGRFLLGDEMGVGKTIQAIGVSYLYKDEWPLLIIWPSTIVSHLSLFTQSLEILMERRTVEMVTWSTSKPNTSV